MDLQIRSLSRQSTLSGTAFNDGDRVVSFLYRGASGELERSDVLASETEGYAPEGPVLCRWTQRMRVGGDGEAEARRQSMFTAEEMFLSLYEETEEGEDEAMTAQRDLLKSVLALMLERKRVLRSLSGGRVLHVRNKREFPVPQVEITPENILMIEDQLQAIVGS